MSSATDKDHANCEEMMKMTRTSNTKAQKLIDSIESLGCTLPSNFFVCR